MCPPATCRIAAWSLMLLALPLTLSGQRLSESRAAASQGVEAIPVAPPIMPDATGARRPYVQWGAIIGGVGAMAWGVNDLLNGPLHELGLIVGAPLVVGYGVLGLFAGAWSGYAISFVFVPANAVSSKATLIRMQSRPLSQGPHP